MNLREEVISLLRGQFAVPVLSHLAERGLIDRMRQGAFSAATFPDIGNRRILHAIFAYLESVGLLQAAPGGDGFTTTKLGNSVLNRVGAFLILNSYRDYFDCLPELLDGTATPTVNRRRNVLGSGSLHSRKFFPHALELVRGSHWQYIADVGCGDGTFLARFLGEHPGAIAVPVDLSEVAIHETTTRLAGMDVRPVVADGYAVDQWAASVPRTGRGLVTLWFVVHEFSQAQPDRVVEFFQRLAVRLPRAEVLVGEIVAVPPDALANHRGSSIMPEFLLFHALSGQGVLSWAQHQEVLAAIPYSIAAQRHFDTVQDGYGQHVPSSVLWHLKPKEVVHDGTA